LGGTIRVNTASIAGIASTSTSLDTDSVETHADVEKTIQAKSCISYAVVGGSASASVWSLTDAVIALVSLSSTVCVDRAGRACTSSVARHNANSIETDAEVEQTIKTQASISYTVISRDAGCAAAGGIRATDACVETYGACNSTVAVISTNIAVCTATAIATLHTDSVDTDAKVE
jgi:hypothetical protein